MEKARKEGGEEEGRGGGERRQEGRRRAGGEIVSLHQLNTTRLLPLLFILSIFYWCVSPE